MLAVEAQSRAELDDDVASERWLLGLSIYEEDHSNRWTATARSILADETTGILAERLEGPKACG